MSYMQLLFCCCCLSINVPFPPFAEPVTQGQSCGVMLLLGMGTSVALGLVLGHSSVLGRCCGRWKGQFRGVATVPLSSPLFAPSSVTRLEKSEPKPVTKSPS